MCILIYPACKAHAPYCLWVHHLFRPYPINGTVLEGRTHMMSLIVAFRNFAKAPKNEMQLEQFEPFMPSGAQGNQSGILVNIALRELLMCIHTYFVKFKVRLLI